MEPRSKSPHINPSVLVIVIILSVVFLCSGLLHMLARCLGRRRLRRARGPASISSVTRGHLLQQLFSLPDCGVEQAVIDTLPVFVYGSIRGLKDSADCAVCLSAFRDEDRLRLLPPCRHAFHVRCIDTWLHTNSTCPLCRRSLLPEATEPAAITAPPSPESNPSPPTVQADGAEKMVMRVELGKVRSFGSAESPLPGTTSSRFARSFSMGEYEYVVKPTHRSTRSEDVVWSGVCSPSQLQSGHQHHFIEIIPDPGKMLLPEKVAIDVGGSECPGLLPPLTKSASLRIPGCSSSLKKSASLSWLRCDSGSPRSLAPSISLLQPEKTSIDVEVDGESSKPSPSLKKSTSLSWSRGRSSKVFCVASSIV